MQSIPCFTRSNLDGDACVVIDTVLKDLKLANRRIQAVSRSFQLEIQILSRLFYRGKNQHRTAIFWRRVDEVRRYGRRLQGMDIHSEVDSVRQTFWNNE